jgi:hypothetical protein
VSSMILLLGREEVPDGEFDANAPWGFADQMRVVA